MRLAPLGLLLLSACGADLPAEWSTYEPVTSLTQSECDGNPYEDFDEHVEGDLGASPLEVGIREGHFRCEQEVEGFYRIVEGDIEVLVQPRDMDPSMVAACDCLYDIDMTVALDVDLAPGAVRVYRRWDNQNDPNEPVLVGEIVRDE